jgi:molecular chaperone GrpE
MRDESENVRSDPADPVVIDNKWENVAAEVREANVSNTPDTDPALQVLQKQLVEVEQKAEENWQKCLRVQAEMDNLRRRTEQDIVNAHKFGLEKLVRELLSVMDSFDSAAIVKVDENKNQDVSEWFTRMQEGMLLTRHMLLSALEKFSVTVVDPLGEIFNPDVHQAMSVQDNKDVPVNSIVAVMQKGYCLHGRLLRPALVVIAQ